MHHLKRNIHTKVWYIDPCEIQAVFFRKLLVSWTVDVGMYLELSYTRITGLRDRTLLCSSYLSLDLNILHLFIGDLAHLEQ